MEFTGSIKKDLAGETGAALRGVVMYALRISNTIGGMKKWCLFCGAEISFGLASRKFCCDRCRRKYQDRRRLEERREKRVIPLDPWGRCDVDDWTVEEILANALLDPLPVGLGWDDVGGRERQGNAKGTEAQGETGKQTREAAQAAEATRLQHSCRGKLKKAVRGATSTASQRR